MKKVLYFFAFILAVTGFTSIFLTNEVYAEEPVSTKVELTQENFNLATFEDDTKTEFVLKSNIELIGWQPLENFNKIFDGNGFVVTTDAPIFSTLTTNAVVKNLGVKVLKANEESEEFIYNTSSNFGLLANNSYEALIEKCFVYGEMSVNLTESASVGGLVGYANKSTIRNCFAVVSINLTQNNVEAQSTIIGGLVGSAISSTILFSYSAPYSELLVKNLITVEINAENATTNLIAGGLAGIIQGATTSKIINNFSTGLIVQNYTTTNNKYIGTLFGQVENFSSENLNHCCVIESADWEVNYGFVGNNYTETTFTKQPSSIFTSIEGFTATYKDSSSTTNRLLWNEDLEWNYDYLTNEKNTIWCKQSQGLASVKTPYIELQVFQNFNITIDTTYVDQGIGIDLSINNADGTPLETPTTSFKYGTAIQIKLEISESYILNNQEIDFRPYKKIKQLTKSGSDAPQLISFIDESHKQAIALITVNGATSGSYYAISENIEFTLRVQSADESQGTVKIRQTNALSKYPIKYGDELTFTATPVAGGTYVFEKWSWQLEDFSQDTVYASNRSITINFGGTDNDLNKTYLTFNEEIPYDEINGIFTLVASFSTNSKLLTIQSNMSKECCDIFVRQMQQTTITDYTELYSSNEIVGISFEISIIVRSGFTFNYWQTGNGLPMSMYIETINGESATSTTINLTLKSEDLVIIANFTENDAPVLDLTWLWWTLGGAGGVGLITLITFLIIQKRRRESFISY